MNTELATRDIFAAIADTFISPVFTLYHACLSSVVGRYATRARELHALFFSDAAADACCRYTFTLLFADCLLR